MATARQRAVDEPPGGSADGKIPGLFRGRSLLFALPRQFLSQSTTRKRGARRFTYVYEATTAAPGSRESENWITWGTSPREDRRFNEVDIRDEIEFGVTEHFQIGLYLADWGYREDPAEHEHGFSYQDVSD